MSIPDWCVGRGPGRGCHKGEKGKRNFQVSFKNCTRKLVSIWSYEAIGHRKGCRRGIPEKCRQDCGNSAGSTESAGRVLEAVLLSFAMQGFQYSPCGTFQEFLSRTRFCGQRLRSSGLFLSENARTYFSKF